MKLRRLEIHNFRQYAGPESVVFPESGVVGILGANEVGKSTLIEAISFALYGSKAVRGTMAGLVWTGAPARSHAGVELEFEVGGVAYEVQRGGKRASLLEVGPASHAEVPCHIPNPQSLAESISAVDAAIETIIGMTWEEFSTTYLCRQRDLGAIAAMGPTERRRFFLKVLGVGRIDEALSGCRGAKNQLRAEVDGMARGLGEREPLLEQVDAMASYLKATTAELEAVSTRIAGEREAADTAKSELEALRTAHEVHEELTRRVGQGKTNRARTLEEVERVEAQLEEVEAPDPERLEGIRASLEGVRGRLRQLEEARRKDASGEERQRGAASAEYQRLRGIAEVLNNLGAEAKCPTCRQELGEGYIDTLEGVESERDEALGWLEAATANVAKLSEPSSREVALAEKVGAHEADIGRLEAQARAFEASRRAQEELGRWRAQLEREEGQLEADINALEELDFDPNAYASAQHSADATAELLGESLREASGLRERKKAAEDGLARAREALAAFEERDKALAELKGRHATHEAAAERLAAFRVAMSEGIEPELEALASGFVHILTDGRHEGLVFGDGLTPRLLESGLEAEVISGGAEDITAIAIRLAISQMIAERAGHPLSLLVLDEPFGSLDAVRRGNVLELIRRLGGVFEQVLLVTHVEEAKDAVDTVISVSFDEAEGFATIQGVA